MFYWAEVCGCQLRKGQRVVLFAVLTHNANFDKIILFIRAISSAVRAEDSKSFGPKFKSLMAQKIHNKGIYNYSVVNPFFCIIEIIVIKLTCNYY